MDQTPNLNLPIPNAEAVPPTNISGEFPRIALALTMLDLIIHTLQGVVANKADAAHTQAISTITGLTEALAAKMPANATFSLDSLTDVQGAADALVNYVLVKKSTGQWEPSTALAALGIHNHAISEVVGLADELLALASNIATKADAVTVTGALAARLRSDAGQGLTAAQQGQARANLGGGVLAGSRNKLINGDFNIWQRATSQTSNGYGSDDRWANEQQGSTKTHSRQAFSLGQSAVPGNPAFFSRTVVVSAAGSASFVFKRQKIEGVRTLAGRRATLTFYAKADANKNMAVEILQRFGTGGAPSADVRADTRKVALTSAWQKFSYALDLPSIAGKTLGSNGDDFLQLAFWFDAGSSFNAATDTLGQQSGTFDIAHVSLVEGDATTEEDPFAPRHPQQELALCQRYYVRFVDVGMAFTGGAGAVHTMALVFPVVMRTIPTTSNVLGGVALNLSAVTVSRISQSNFTIELTPTATGYSYGLQYNVNFDAEL